MNDVYVFSSLSLSSEYLRPFAQSNDTLRDLMNDLYRDGHSWSLM